MAKYSRDFEMLPEDSNELLPIDLDELPTQEEAVSGLQLGQEDVAKKINNNLNLLRGGQPVNKPSVNDAISALLGLQSSSTKAAQDAQNQMQLTNILARAGSQIGAAISPLGNIKPNEENFKALDEMAKQPVANLVKSQELQKSALDNRKLAEGLKNELSKEDPSSDISNMSRDIARTAMKQAGMDPSKIPDNISASNLEKLYPSIVSLANHRIQAQTVSANREIQTTAKQEKQVQDSARKMGEDLDPTRFRSGEMGKNQARVNAAGRIEGLLQQFPDGNIPKIQTRELAASVAALLTNGSQTAVSNINELVPHTSRGKAAEISEWVTGNPTGLQQQQFIKMFADTAQREKQIAQNQITSAQVKKAYSTHGKLKEQAPDDFYRILSTQTGMDVDALKSMDSKKGFKGDLPVEPKISEQDKEAIDWAKKNKDDPRAKKILQMHGM